MTSVEPLFAEVHRVLKPGARYVLLEWLRVPGLLAKRLGFLHREPAELRASLSRAGFSRIETMDLRPYRVIQASRD